MTGRDVLWAKVCADGRVHDDGPEGLAVYDYRPEPEPPEPPTHIRPWCGPHRIMEYVRAGEVSEGTAA